MSTQTDGISEPWPTPDWRHWLTVESVTLEEAVALSLGRCPKHRRRRLSTTTSWKPVAEYYDPARPWSPGSESYAAAARGDRVPVTTNSVQWWFPVHGTPEGPMRLATLRAALERADERVPRQASDGERVRLADFARFASDHDWVMPARLSGLVATLQTGCDVASRRAADAAIAPNRPRRKKLSQPDQEEAILVWLKGHGYDPMAMPKPPLGIKPWPLREALRMDLGLTIEVARKAFKRLREDGRMKNG